MTTSVDHRKVFARLAAELPPELLGDLFVAGSLAAACHFAGGLGNRAVKTKDADLVVHPAGNVRSAREIAELLIANGWRRTDACYPQPGPTPTDTLRAIRLHPPEHEDYFIELLNVSDQAQQPGKTWIALELSDGWYGLPSFEFLALTAIERERSVSGLEYAAPCMMALANLLSHQEVGTVRIRDTRILRSAKDLGRAIALAWLAGPDAVDGWPRRWRRALRQCYPQRWQSLALRVGSGLDALLADAAARSRVSRRRRPQPIWSDRYGDHPAQSANAVVSTAEGPPFVVGAQVGPSSSLPRRLTFWPTSASLSAAA